MLKIKGSKHYLLFYNTLSRIFRIFAERMKNIRHILTLMTLWLCTTMQGQTGMDWNQTAMTALQMGNAAGAEEILRAHEQAVVEELGAFFYCSQLVSIGMVRHNQDKR